MVSLSLTDDQLKPLSINQIKKVSSLMGMTIAEINRKLGETEKERKIALREMGNLLHESVPVSNNEVSPYQRKDLQPAKFYQVVPIL